MPEEIRKTYRQLSEEETRAARLKHSSFYVFGSEESYGYSGADFVRDKDGNAAGIMFCEMAAYAKSRGRTVDQLLDEAFAGFGYFDEKNASIYFEGAEGADKIARLLESYASRPPPEVAGSKVAGITDFEAKFAPTLDLVKLDVGLGRQLRVQQTPTFFINGLKVEGAWAPQYFDQAIAYELQHASK